MYPLASLIVELGSARRKLLDVLQVPDSKTTEECGRAGINPPFEAHVKPSGTEITNSSMIKRWLNPVLEHGCVPAVALALAVTPINSRSWQRHDSPNLQSEEQ